MYQLVLIIQCITIVAVLAECWVVFANWKGPLHSYLFLASAASLVNSLGYFFELLSRSVNAYLTALKLSYAGRVWVVFALFLFITELVRIKVPAVFKAVMALFNIATYVIVITTMETGLYYRASGFEVRGNFPFFIHTDGIWHHLWSATLVLYALYGLVALFFRFRKEKNVTARRRILMVILATLTMSLFLVISIFKPLPICRIYDVTMLSFPIASIFMFIAIFRYNLLDTATLAREYVIDRLSEAIIAVNDAGDVSYFNEPARALFPQIHYDPESVADTINKALEKDEPLRFGDRIYTPEANTLGSRGNTAGTIFALMDDTQHYNYLAQLEEQKQIADNANRAKSAFLANMSHEIRTPINAVLGMDEMIIRESTEKNIRSYALDIKTAGRTLLSLINDILDFSKIEEGRMEILPTQYELSSVINDLVNMIKPRADKKGLGLEVKVDKDIPHILYGDEIRIRQVVINLLTNAVKYTNEGRIELSVGFSKTDDENIMLSFAVADTGIGIKEEDMERLFSPFARLEEKRNRSIEGTGLGMSIVQQLLELMDSRLDVSSEYGKGSKFSFELKQKVIKWDPMGDISERFSADAEDADAYRELFHAPDAHILVVDDNEVNLTVICNLLKRTMIDVDTALSGMDAIALAKGKHYDIAFIDHMMPDMDGIETLRCLKADTDAENTVCIALTANAVSGARERYLEAGFADYLSKPVDGRRLEEMIRKNLPEDKIRPADDVPDVPEDGGVMGDGEGGAGHILQQIDDIPEIDTGSGIANCGSKESFMSVLTVFHRTARQKADEIESLYGSGDIENYTIKVHALKSSSRIIGAAELSDLARRLEEAGKSGDNDFIRDNTDILLEKYRLLDDKLAVLDDKSGNKKELTAAMRKEAFATIAEIARSMDYQMMETVINDLKGYDLAPEDGELLGRIEEKLLQLDWDSVAEMADGASEQYSG